MVEYVSEYSHQIVCSRQIIIRRVGGGKIVCLYLRDKHLPIFLYTFRKEGGRNISIILLIFVFGTCFYIACPRRGPFEWGLLIFIFS